MSFIGSHVVRSINGEFAGVYVETITNCVKYFRRVNHTILIKSDYLILVSDSPMLKMIKFQSQLVFKLPFFIKKVCLFYSLKFLKILRNWLDKSHLCPVDVIITTCIASFYFYHFSTSHQPYFFNAELKGIKLPVFGDHTSSSH